MIRKNLSVTFLWLLVLFSSAFAQIQTERILIDGAIDAGYWIYVVDFDQDGDEDILAASLNSGLRWYQNDGAGNFTKIDISSAFTGAWAVHANDMDNDGDLDAVACSNDLDQIAWFERRADDNFKKQVIADNILEAHSVYSADLDNDGDIDVMAALWETDKIAIFENDGTQNFTKQVIDGNFSSAHTIFAADMDNDGDIDILAGGGSKTAMYENKGSLNFSRTLIASFGAFGVHAVDVNRDGLLDVIRDQRPDNKQDIDWLENLGNGSFAERTVETNYGESWSQTATDLDLDGDIDILAAGFVPNKVSYWLNDGNENFSEIVLDNNLTRPRCVALGDFDQDGDKDIAVITRNNDDLFWYQVAGSPDPVMSVTVTSPNGGETIEADSTFIITWASVGAIDSVKVEYSIDNGASWNEITGGLPNNDSLVWAVPNLETIQALVRVSDITNAAITDESDNSFTIEVPFITVTRPNSGESWIGGEIQAITWNSSVLISNIKLEYSIDSGMAWNEITASTANINNYDWLVPDTQTGTALVRVSDAADGTPADSSDSTFTIIGSSLTITSPNGGETWIGASNQTITWTTSGGVQQVNLEYSTDNGQSWNLIAGNETNTNSFLWTVPDQQTTQALVRVSDAADGLPFDRSDSAFTIFGSELTITAPNGGESWLSDSTYSITWTSSGSISAVKLEYSLDNGQTWNEIIAGTGNDGVFDWTLPNAQTQTALVRISDAADGTPQDVCDSVFTINNAVLLLLSPNGGEAWFGDSEEKILWSFSGTIDFVKIEYSINNGANWGIIHPNATNSGSYTWSVLNFASSEVLVRISDAADGLPSDRSDSTFTIIGSGITVISPNGGEILYVGTRQMIEWTSTGPLDLVQLVLDNSPVDSIIIADNLPNTGSYEWQVPNIVTDSARILIYDATGGMSFDASDSIFSIKKSSLTLISPNGGETWLGNSEETITWETAGVVDSVNLEYSADGGINWHAVASALPNSGNYVWFIPNVLSLRARVRITSAADPSVSDDSDDPFAIISSSLTVLSPNGGEQWQGGTTRLITWHSSGIILAVDIEYSPDFGATWKIIADSTANDGIYAWRVANIESDSVLVRVSNNSTGIPMDVSNERFQIIANVSGISSTTGVMPEKFELKQNYPNPFNMDTRIDFAVAKFSRVNLTIYNIRGEQIITLHNGFLPAGEYSALWNGRNKHGRSLTSGIYVYSIKIGDWQNSKRLLLLK